VDKIDFEKIKQERANVMVRQRRYTMGEKNAKSLGAG
jgi:hypothetical protein